MPAMQTLAGQMLHAQRAATVVVHRGIVRPLIVLIAVLDRQPVVRWLASHPVVLWLDRAPRWMKLGTMEWWVAAWLVMMTTLVVGSLLGVGR
jgi:hypothetical protein